MRTDMITTFFYLHNYLRDENVEVVPLEEATHARALREVVGNDNPLPPRFKAPQSSTAISRGGDSPTQEEFHRSVATLWLKRPAHDVGRSSTIEA